MVLVPLIIRATDQASGVINRVSGALGGLSKPVGQAAQGMGGLTNAIAGGVLKANLLTGAFTGVMGAAQSALGTIQGAIATGAELQLSNLTAASSVAALMGTSFDEASVFVDKLNESLARTSASLPGSTSTYTALARSVLDNAIPAFRELDGTVNNGALQKGLTDLVSNFGALGAGAGLDQGDLNLGLSKALGGASLSELQTLRFGEQLPQIMGELERKLTEAGVESLGDVQIKERFQLLSDVSGQFMTSEFKSAASSSISGLFEGFRSALLDPVSGLFGVGRELLPNVEGAQTLITAFSQTLNTVIGPEGILFGIAEVFGESSLGNTDLLRVVYDGIQSFNGFLGSINTRIENLNEALDEGGSLTDMLGIYAKDAIADIGKVLGINTSDFGSTFNDIGQRIGQGISGTLRGLLPLLNKGFQYAAQWAGDRLRDTDFAALGGQIGGALGSVLGNLQGSLAVFISGLDFDSILLGVGAGAVALLKFTGGAIGGFLGGFTGSIEGKLAEARQNVLDRIGNTARSVFDGIAEFLSGVLRSIPRSIAVAVTTALSGVPGVGGALTGAIAASLPPAQTGAAQVASLGLRPVAGSRADGQMPGSFSSLLSAAQVESRRAPAGASLVVANTSEAIIPRSTVRAVQPIAATAAGGVQIGSISVQVNEAKTPQLTAEAVLQLIQSKFEQEYNAQLA